MNEDQRLIVRLAESCTIAEAEELKTALLGRLREEREVSIDAGSVRQIDTAALQLLVAFVRDRHGTGGSVCWAARSGAFDKAVALLGLREALGLRDGA